MPQQSSIFNSTSQSNPGNIICGNTNNQLFGNNSIPANTTSGNLFSSFSNNSNIGNQPQQQSNFQLFSNNQSNQNTSNAGNLFSGNSFNNFNQTTPNSNLFQNNNNIGNNQNQIFQNQNNNPLNQQNNNMFSNKFNMNQSNNMSSNVGTSSIQAIIPIHNLKGTSGIQNGNFHHIFFSDSLQNSSKSIEMTRKDDYLMKKANKINFNTNINGKLKTNQATNSIGNFNANPYSSNSNQISGSSIFNNTSNSIFNSQQS